MNRSEAGKLGWAKTKSSMLAYTAQKKNEARTRYAEAPRKCRRCEDLISYEQRCNSFCSASCAAFWNNAQRMRRSRSCEVCFKELKRVGSRFCSNVCQATAQWQIRLAAIVATGEIVAKDPRSARRYLAETRGWKCETCKITTWREQPTPLVLDHIDGNSDNWAVLNLRLLCPNCDAQTLTYKSKNRGNGRFSRRQRYRRGQSY